MTLTTGPLKRLATGLGFTEGPCWLADHQMLLFTDIPANMILCWSETAGLRPWATNAHFAIGLARARDGRVLACEHSTRSLAAWTLDARGLPASRQVLARGWRGQVLNSTNDVICARDGTILFTDPPFGVRAEGGQLYGYQQAMELPFCGVFRVGIDADSLVPMVTDIYRPNGLCLSPDEGVLYVSDSSDRHHKVLAMDLGPDLTPGPLRDFAVMPVGVPDGMRVDAAGNLWIAGGDGVHVHAPDGRAIGHVPVPEMVTNIDFGGPDLSQLYITAVSSLYRAQTTTRCGRA